MKKYELMLDTVKFSRKPTKKETGAITRRFKYFKVDLQELGEYLSKGCTITPSVFKGDKKSENFIQKQLYFLDFDSGASIEEIKEVATQNGLTVNAYYKSFSYSDTLPKYRIVFISNEIITERKTDSLIVRNLIETFSQISGKEADKACKDNYRMFYGTKYPFVILSETENDLTPFSLNKDDQKKESKAKKEKAVKNLVEKYKDLAPDNANRKERKKIEKFDFNKLYNRVQIYQDFARGKKLDYATLFGLATNLNNIVGGKKHMIDLLDVGDYNQEKYDMVENVCAADLMPMLLSNFSPYPEDHKLINCIVACSERKTFQETRPVEPKFISENKIEKKSIHYCRMELRAEFNNALESDKSTLLISPTSTGKSELLLDLENVIIALPYHRLIAEVAGKMRVDYLTTAERPYFSDEKLNKKITELYERENFKQVTTIISGISKGQNSTFDLTDDDYAIALNYINQNKACLGTNKTILTTHAKLATGFFNNEDKVIIIDESPERFFKSIKQINLNDIDDDALLDEIFKNNFGHHSLTTLTTTSKSFKVQQLVEAKNYCLAVTSEGGKVVRFYHQVKPDLSKKYVILSATPNVDFIERTFGDIEIRKVSELKPVGRVHQDMTFIGSNKALKDLIPDFKALGNVKKCITFKSKIGQLPSYVESMCYHNSEGSNSFSGEDLVCFGTPSLPSSVILLKAQSYGIKFTEQDTFFSYRSVEYNGVQFNFATFKSEELQRVHFNEIENEIKQSIGRARIGMHNCTVYLYSDFPVVDSLFCHLPKPLSAAIKSVEEEE